MIPFRFFRLASLFSCLLLLLAGTSCSDDDADGTTAPIQIRLVNESGLSLINSYLGFEGTATADDLVEYGFLDSDAEPTNYQGFEAAGTCSIRFLLDPNNQQPTNTFFSTCECICPLEAGLYTARITVAEIEGEERLQVTIEAD